MADRVGQQLGNYRLTLLIGRGGFSDVYLGEHIYLGTQAAVKVLTTKLADDEVDQFIQEARTMAHLEHPNILRVLEFGIEDNTPFLVLSYAANGTLRQSHPRGTRLPLDTIVSYVNQVAAALQYIHSKKLIHRDIKPENLLVGRQNEILLSDFGISLIAQTSRYQNVQEIVGTASYMAPEQFEGQPRPASDQYALGVVVYEWLCGDRPFNGSFTEIAFKQTATPPPPLHEKFPEISQAVEIVVLTALAKEPQQRFASVRAFANALEQASKLSRPISLEKLPQLPSAKEHLSSDISAAPGTPSPPSRPRSGSTDIISTLPTAPYIVPLPTTEVKDASSLPPSVRPQPSAAKEQISPEVPGSDPTRAAPTEHVQLEPPLPQQGEVPPAVLTSGTVDYAPTAYVAPPEVPIQIVPPVLSPQQQLPPKDTPVASAIDNLPTVYLPSEPPVAGKEQTLLAGSSANRCPYCTAETRPGDNFCLNCGNRLIPPTPSSGQVEAPQGDMTIPAQEEMLDYAPQEARDQRVGTLMGNLTMPSVISPWVPEKDASALLPDEQIGAGAQSILVSQSSAIAPPSEPVKATDQAKEDRLKEGDSLYKAKRYEEALAIYEGIIQMDPQDARAHNNKGNALWRLKRHKHALAAYEYASTLDPNNALIWLAKGNFLYSLRRYDDALADYNRAKSIDPLNQSIHISMGNVLYALRRYDEALVAYEAALTIAPEDTSTLIAQGEVFYKTKRYKEAFDVYDRAISINPDDERIWIAKGNKLYKLKRYKEALAAYEKVLAITDTNSSIWNIKGNLLYRLEQYTEALEAYTKALTITPRKARTWADKGAVLYKLARYNEALDAYKFARFLDPNDATISERYDMLCDRLADLKARQDSPELAQMSWKDIPQQPKSGPPVSQVSPRTRSHPGQSHASTPPREEGIESRKAAEDIQPDKQYDVFLSHSHTDAKWVENLANRLVDEHNFRVWLDKWMLIPGKDWIQAIAEGIEQARCCAICIGEQTPVGWFEREIKRALDRQTKEYQKGQSFGVFAILLPGAKDVNVDDFLGLNTWVDFRHMDTDHAFHILVSGIKGEPPGRWPLKETIPQMTPLDLETKLRDLHRFEEKNWVHPTVAVEFQRMVLKKLLLDVDESEGQQE